MLSGELHSRRMALGHARLRPSLESGERHFPRGTGALRCTEARRGERGQPSHQVLLCLHLTCVIRYRYHNNRRRSGADRLRSLGRLHLIIIFSSQLSRLFCETVPEQDPSPFFNSSLSFSPIRVSVYDKCESQSLQRRDSGSAIRWHRLRESGTGCLRTCFS